MLQNVLQKSELVSLPVGWPMLLQTGQREGEECAAGEGRECGGEKEGEQDEGGEGGVFAP